MPDKHSVIKRVGRVFDLFTLIPNNKIISFLLLNTTYELLETTLLLTYIYTLISKCN